MLLVTSLSVTTTEDAQAKEGKPRFQIHINNGDGDPHLVPPKRYRDFERLAAGLRNCHVAFPLPGKLMIHSASAIEQRRAGLESALRKLVVNQDKLPTPLLDFLHLTTTTSLAFKDSANSGDQPVMVVAESMSSDSEDEDYQTLISEDGKSETELLAVAVLAQRARVRERAANVRLLQHSLLVVAVISFLAVAMTKRRKGFEAFSALFAASGAVFLPRILMNDPPARGFGMDNSPTDSSDSADALNMRAWLDAMSLARRSHSPPADADQASSSALLKQSDDAKSALVVEAHPVVAQLDNLHASNRFVEAWQVAKDVMDVHDTEVVWRVARSCYYVSKGDPTGLPVIQVGLSLCQKSLNKRDDQALVHKWFAILSNAAGERGSTKERILSAGAFERHTRRALELEPTDPTLWYMMGRFSFDVAKLSWMERAAARAVFGSEPPRTTYEQALQEFQTAFKLRPSAGIALEVGRCHMALGDKTRAREMWGRCVSDEFDMHAPEDLEAKHAAQALLN